MQEINKVGRFRAEWGPFLIFLDNRHRRCLAEIRQRDDGSVVTTMPELPPRTSSEAIEWAAEQLQRRGAVAMVDGEYRSVAAFLSFVEEAMGK